MASRYLDLINFYNKYGVVYSINRDQVYYPYQIREWYEWLALDQGIKNIVKVERKLTECLYNTETGITYYPDGRMYKTIDGLTVQVYC